MLSQCAPKPPSQSLWAVESGSEGRSVMFSHNTQTLPAASALTDGRTEFTSLALSHPAFTSKSVSSLTSSGVLDQVVPPFVDLT
jgi:hypothetical protein